MYTSVELTLFWVPLTIGVIVGLIALGGVAINTALEDVKNREASADKPLVIHMHVTLRIVINGEQVAIPKYIGMDPSLYHTHELDKYGIKNPRTYPLHTHDFSGVIHIESTEIRTFTLGQFFDVWGQQFDESCVFDKCNNELNKVRMYVDDEESLEFREHVLKNGELIIIEYGSPKGEYQL